MGRSEIEGTGVQGAKGLERRPDVSFIMPAHNVAPYVQAAVTSTLRQAAVDVELIVVDDASTDDTANIVSALAEGDDRITLIRQAKNAGAAATRNVAIDCARGEWLAFVDADDLVEPQRSRRLLDLARISAADVVADNFERFNDAGTLRSTMIPEGAEPYSFFVDSASFIRRNAMFDKRADLGYIKPMFRAAFIRQHGIRHREDIYIGEDYHFCLSCLMAGARFIVTSESFYKYRVRDGSLSWRLTKEDIARLLGAHAAIEIGSSRYGHQMQEAAGFYARSLGVALQVTSTVDNARAGLWLRALASALRNPRSWSVLARFAGKAVSKRLMSTF